MGLIRSLPFIADRRQEGIAQMNLAADSSRYSGLPASAGLAWIYLDCKDYAGALELLNGLISKGYTGRQVLWPMGLVHFRQGQARGTIEIFTEIKESLERQGSQNGYNLGLCDYFIAVGNYWQGNYFEALKNFNSLLSRQVNKDVGKRLDNRYDSANKYKDRIKKIIARRSKNSQN